MAIYRDFDWHRYVTLTNNHYWINNEGIAAVAFVLADEVPESRRLPLEERTEENLANILTALEPDGSSNEGVAYHTYGQINLFRWLDIRDRAKGENTAQASPWFAKSILWDLYSILPGGDDNYGGAANFGDCPTRYYQSLRTIQSWLAHRLGDGIAQWMAQSLDWPALNPMSILWYDPAVSPTDPATLPVWHMCDFKGIFAWRSSWDDDATYFSLKSGAYYGAHEQPDAGHFILHRAGVPYITDLGYSYFKTASEHNLVLVDDSDQYGGQRQWMSAVDPAHWASAQAVLAGPDYFDLLADPGPMVDHPALTLWNREVVGLGPDVFLIRDTLDATAQVTYHWLLHSYMTDPPTSVNRTYTYRDRRTENPFSTVDDHHFVITPQDQATPLTVTDLSHDAWTNQVEETWYVPEIKLDGGGYNSDFESYQLGDHVHRQITGQSAWSLVALTFTDALTATSWSTAQVEAASIEADGQTFALVFWNKTNSPITGFHGFDFTGKMAGRMPGDSPAFFGRAVTRFVDSGQTLLDTQAPVDLFARTEDQASGTRYALLRTEAETTVSLRCDTRPSSALLDGASITFQWNSGLVTFTLPAGTHRLDLQ